MHLMLFCIYQQQQNCRFSYSNNRTHSKLVLYASIHLQNVSCLQHYQQDPKFTKHIIIRVSVYVGIIFLTKMGDNNFKSEKCLHLKAVTHIRSTHFGLFFGPILQSYTQNIDPNLEEKSQLIPTVKLKSFFTTLEISLKL